MFGTESHVRENIAIYSNSELRYTVTFMSLHINACTKIQYKTADCHVLTRLTTMMLTMCLYPCIGILFCRPA